MKVKAIKVIKDWDYVKEKINNIVINEGRREDFFRGDWKDNVLKEESFAYDLEFQIEVEGEEYPFIFSAHKLIQDSRFNLCNLHNTSPHTKLYAAIKEKMQEVEPAVAKNMVKECVYRGFCPMASCCNYSMTDRFAEEWEAYRKHNTILK